MFKVTEIAWKQSTREIRELPSFCYFDEYKRIKTSETDVKCLTNSFVGSKSVENDTKRHHRSINNCVVTKNSPPLM